LSGRGGRRVAAALSAALLAATLALSACDPFAILSTPPQSEGERRAYWGRHVDNAFLMVGCHVGTETAVQELVDAWYLAPEKVAVALRSMRRRGRAVELDGRTVAVGGSCGHCRDLIRRGRGETCPDLDLDLLAAAAARGR
jgi:hypothetical protein